MEKKDLNQILMNVGKEMQEEQYNSNMENHEFSDKYKNRKKEILNSLETPKMVKIPLPLKAAGIALIITCLSFSVYAAVKRISFTISNEAKDTVTIDVNKNTESYIPPIEITPNYLPVGYTEREGKYSPEDSTPGGLTIIDAGYSTSYKVPDVSDYEELQIRDAKAVIIHREGYEYCWNIYLFYEDTGHVIEVFGYETLSKDEMIKVCENLTYVEVPEKDPNHTYQAFEYQEKVDASQEINTQQNPELFDENSFINIGDKIDCPRAEVPNGVQYSVKSINITDTVNKDLLNMDTAWDYDQVMGYIQEDGTLKPYTRIISEWKDGALQESELGIVKMKNVEVTIDIQNPSDMDIKDLNIQPVWKVVKQGQNELFNDGDTIPGFVPDENFRSCSLYSISYDGMAYYFDSSAFPQNTHFYNMKLEAGETKEIHMWFAIPEDQIDDAYLVFNYFGSSSTPSFIKISQ